MAIFTHKARHWHTWSMGPVSLVASVLLIAAALVAYPFATQSAEAAGGYNATSVVGPAQGLDGDPGSVDFDIATNRAFVADTENHRVLVYDLDSSGRLTDTTPEWVIGQADFTNKNSGLAANRLNTPVSIAYNANRLYVADMFNNRVLVFDVSNITSNGMSAIGIIGQSGYTSANAALPPTQSSLNGPIGLAVNAAGNRLFVSDGNNNRITVYNISSTPNNPAAVNVLGQSGYTSTSVPNPPTASSLSAPRDLAFDPTNGRLYVSDRTNNRIQVFDVSTVTNNQGAIATIGQANATSNGTGLAANRVNAPTAVSVDTNGQRLFVSDTANNRVLMFNVSTIGTDPSATRYFGQPNFTTGTSGANNDDLNSPRGLKYNTSTNQIFVPQKTGNRLSIFDVDTQVLTTSLPNATNTSGYSQTLTASNPNGTTTWTRTTGTLPPGLSLSSAGVISGTPSGASGTYNFTVQASTSPSGHGTLTGSRAMSITMNSVAPNVPTSLAQTKTDGTNLPSVTLFDFESGHQNWTVDGTNTRAHSTSTVRTGTGALQVNKPSGSTSAYPTGSLSATDLSANGDELSAWIYVPSGAGGTYWGGQIDVRDSSGWHSGTWVNWTKGAWNRVVVTKANGATFVGTNQVAILANTDSSASDSFFIDDVQHGGITTNQSSVRFTGLVSDTNNPDSLQLCIEAKPVGTAFNGTGETCGSAVSYSGSPVSATATVTGLSSNSYHWQGRTRDSGGLYSSWVSYGGNAESDADFIVQLNNAPNAPTGLAQTRTDTTAIPTGDWTNESSVRFTGSVSDSNNPDQNQLCIEAKPLGTAFSNTEDSCGTAVSVTGSSQSANHTLAGLGNGQYHWQARSRDAGGLYSPWVSFGANAESSPDFGIDTTAPTAPTVRDGATQGVDVGFNDGSLSTLGANWSGAGDAHSGVGSYQYSIGTSPGATDVRNWTQTSATEITETGLSLRTSQSYYFNVRVIDVAGNVSTVVSSNGQLVAPTLTFGVSAGSITFDAMSPSNSFAPPTRSINVTTSTNAYGGYTINQAATSLLSSGSASIPMYSGTYASPTTWSGTGFGFTTSDTALQSFGNRFGSGTLYAGLAVGGTGPIVADESGPVTANVKTLTYRLQTAATFPAGSYSTGIRLGATASF